MKNLMAMIIIVVISVFCVVAVIFYQAGYHNGRLDTLPSQSQVQEIIGVEVDGVIGAESRRVWDATIEQRECDEAAVPIMEKFMADFDKKYFPETEF